MSHVRNEVVAGRKRLGGKGRDLGGQGVSYHWIDWALFTFASNFLLCFTFLLEKNRFI